jgi:hypothetical protein
MLENTAIAAMSSPHCTDRVPLPLHMPSFRETQAITEGQAGN